MKEATNAIAKARKAAGLTQVKLAEIIGCTQSQIANWESGFRNPGAKSLAKLAKALGVTMESLMED